MTAVGNSGAMPEPAALLSAKGMRKVAHPQQFSCLVPEWGQQEQVQAYPGATSSLSPGPAAPGAHK